MEINAKKRLEASDLEIGEEIFAEINLNEAIHGDLADLIKEHLLPGITAAKERYERAVADTERKLKAWALLHCQQARKLNKPTDLFEKILRNPKAAAHLSPFCGSSGDDEVIRDALPNSSFSRRACSLP
jgi:hypothetical protein